MNFKATRSFIFVFCCCMCVSAQTAEKISIKLGIDRLREAEFADLIGKRVGLVANPASVDSRGKSTVEILQNAKGVRLMALFGPEHGVGGKVEAGRSVGSYYDKRFGIHAYSLYGKTRKPTPEMLKDIDILVYDLQDIGCRSYTYISTLGMVMEAAMENGKQVIVLDRPNPLGGMRVEGSRLDPKFRSFVGQYDIPYVYGLTPGELAHWINVKYLSRPCNLKVIEMTEWNRSTTWDRTGLQWMPTSPNIPSFESALGYAATGILGEIGVTNGVKEKLPFQIITSENLDASWFAQKMNSYDLKGIQFDSYHFYPSNGKYRSCKFSGVRLKIDPQAEGNLTAVAIYAFPLLKKAFPKRNYFQNKNCMMMFDKLYGSDALRRAFKDGTAATQIVASWNDGVARWKEERKPFLLYQ
ncbi:MAG: exo-beta-N-acetylmuramidase NamZ family protein [Verrucomicrobiota bacterium]